MVVKQIKGPESGLGGHRIPVYCLNFSFIYSTLFVITVYEMTLMTCCVTSLSTIFLTNKDSAIYSQFMNLLKVILWQI